MPDDDRDSMQLSETTPIVAIENIEPAHNAGGLSVYIALFFLIGDVIGVGALALPNALARSGYTGILTILCASGIAIYNGIQLGKCWMMLLHRYPEYRTHCRFPYAAIGEKALGKYMKYIVYIAIGFTCLGTCVIYLLLSAQNIHSILEQAGVELNFCAWMAIFACGLVPLSWFGSPKDFKWIAILAYLTATGGLILIFAQLMVELPQAKSVKYHYPQGFQLYFLSFGAILAAFSGASTFPTIQHDMKDPQKFTLAVVIAYIYSFIVYTTIAVSGYYVYGETVSPNILMALQDGPVKITAMILYILHLTFAYIIFLNPPVQNIEELLNIPNTKCNWKRLLLRSCLVACILFIAESIPHFGALLDLLGGSSSAFLTFIAPPLFYIYLSKEGHKDENGEFKSPSLLIKVLNCFIIFIGIFAACTSTYAAIVRLASPSTFVPPCYVNATAAEHY